MDPFCYLCWVSVSLSCLFIAALWSPAGKGLTLCVMFYCVFVTFQCGVLGQVWYLIVLIPDLCLPYFFCGSFMFLFCLVFAMFCARLFICALWSPAGKGLTSWLSFVVSSVSLSLSHWYPGSGVVLDCIDS